MGGVGREQQQQQQLGHNPGRKSAPVGSSGEVATAAAGAWCIQVSVLLSGSAVPGARWMSAQAAGTSCWCSALPWHTAGLHPLEHLPTMQYLLAVPHTFLRAHPLTHSSNPSLYTPPAAGQPLPSRGGAGALGGHRGLPPAVPLPGRPRHRRPAGPRQAPPRV